MSRVTLQAPGNGQKGKAPCPAQHSHPAKMKKEDSTARSREVAQPSTDVARDCLISRFGVELDVSSRVWPLQRNRLTEILIDRHFSTLHAPLLLWYHVYIVFIFEINYAQSTSQAELVYAKNVAMGLSYLYIALDQCLTIAPAIAKYRNYILAENLQTQHHICIPRNRGPGLGVHDTSIIMIHAQASQVPQFSRKYMARCICKFFTKYFSCYKCA